MAAKRKATMNRKTTAKKTSRKKVVRKDRPKPQPKRTKRKRAHRAPAGSLRPQGKMTQAVKAAIVEELAQSWAIVTACHANNISLETFRVHRRDDPEFAAAVEQAHEAYTQRLRDEVYRRGVEGVSEAVYYKGDVVGYIQKFSDSLLTLHTRRHDKGYVDTMKVDQKTELSGSLVNVKANLAELDPKVRAQLKKLVEAQRAAEGGAKDE